MSASSDRELPLSRLVLPSHSTRPVYKDHVEELRKSLDKDGFLPQRGRLLVRRPFAGESVPSGTYVVVDGTHRYTALMELVTEGRFSGNVHVTILDTERLGGKHSVEQCLLIGERENSAVRRGTTWLDQLMLGVSITNAHADAMRGETQLPPDMGPLARELVQLGSSRYSVAMLTVILRAGQALRLSPKALILLRQVAKDDVSLPMSALASMGMHLGVLPFGRLQPVADLEDICRVSSVKMLLHIRKNTNATKIKNQGVGMANAYCVLVSRALSEWAASTGRPELKDAEDGVEAVLAEVTAFLAAEVDNIPGFPQMQKTEMSRFMEAAANPATRPDEPVSKFAGSCIRYLQERGVLPGAEGGSEAESGGGESGGGSGEGGSEAECGGGESGGGSGEGGSETESGEESGGEACGVSGKANDGTVARKSGKRRRRRNRKPADSAASRPQAEGRKRKRKRRRKRATAEISGDEHEVLEDEEGGDNGGSGSGDAGEKDVATGEAEEGNPPFDDRSYSAPPGWNRVGTPDLSWCAVLPPNHMARFAPGDSPETAAARLANLAMEKLPPETLAPAQIVAVKAAVFYAGYAVIPAALMPVKDHVERCFTSVCHLYADQEGSEMPRAPGVPASGQQQPGAWGPIWNGLQAGGDEAVGARRMATTRAGVGELLYDTSRDAWVGKNVLDASVAFFVHKLQGSKELALPVTGGRILLTEKNCAAQKPHTDFEISKASTLSESMPTEAMQLELSGLFVLATGPDAAELLVWPHAHSILRAAAAAGSGQGEMRALARELPMARVKVPPFSLLVAHRDVVHAGAAGVRPTSDASDASDTRATTFPVSVRYHAYLMPPGHKLRDEVHFPQAPNAGGSGERTLLTFQMPGEER